MYEYYYTSSGGTNTSTDNGDTHAIGMLIGMLAIAYIILNGIVVSVNCCWKFCVDCCFPLCVNCCLVCCQSIAEDILTSSATESSQTEQSFTSSGRESSQEGEGDPGFFKDKVLTLKSLCIFGCLVFYGVIVEVIVLLTVYYGYSKFQVVLVGGVGFVIVLVLSGLCLLVVVWMLMKFVHNDASETSRSQSCISNGTVTPHETQQPDGHERIQSTPTGIHARLCTTPRPLPRRPDIASKPQGTLDSLNSHIPIVLARIENPNIPPSIDTLDEQKTDKKPKDKKKKKKKKKDVEQDNPGTGQ